MNQEATTPAPETKTTKTPSNKKTKILLSLAALVVLALVAAGSYFICTKKSPAPSPSPSPTSEATPSADAAVSPEPSPDSSPEPSPSPTPSPTPSPSPETQSTTLKSQAGHDGFRASNGGGNDSLDIRVGRNSLLIIRGFLSFKIEDLPDDITIEAAELKVYQTGITNNPYGVGLRVMVDHFDYGDSLDHADYSLSSISSSFATLSSDGTVGWKEIDVTDQLKNDLNNSRIRSQFRLHLATEAVGGTPTGDFALFESGDNSHGTGNLPELTIKYH